MSASYEAFAIISFLCFAVKRILCFCLCLVGAVAIIYNHLCRRRTVELWEGERAFHSSTVSPGFAVVRAELSLFLIQRF